MAPRVAETSARQLLREVEVIEAPTDLQRITDHLQLIVALEALPDDVSGMLLRRDSTALIAVNAAHSEHRRRFTIAHEIGHFKLHSGIYIDKDTRINERSSRSSSGLDLDEVQANAFAAELLMPQELLVKEFTREVRAGSRKVAPIVAALSKLFDVSPQAMEIRLKVIGALAPF